MKSIFLFDMRTIIVSFILTCIVSTLVIILLWKQYNKRYRGTTYLVFNFAFQTLALLLFVLRGDIPDWISIDLSNVILIAGIILGYMGLKAYTGLKNSPVPNFVLLAAFGFIHTWFTFARPDLPIRELNMSVVSLIIFIQCAWLLLYRVPRARFHLTRSVGLIYLGFCAVSVARIIKYFVSGKQPSDFLQSGQFDTIMMIVYQMLVIILTYDLALMFSKKLLIDIKMEEEKFSTAFQNSPVAILLTRFPDGHIIEVNSGFLNTTGFQYSDILGKTITEIGIWNSDEDRKEIADELTLSGKVHEKEVKFRKMSGEIFSGLFTAEVINVNNEKCLLSSIDDITATKKYGEAIQYERNLLRTLIDNLPDPVTVKDSEGRYLLNNRAHLDVIGAESQSEVIGKTAFDFFPYEDALSYDIDDKDVINTGRIILDKVESAKHGESGSPYWHLTTKIPLPDNTGNTIRLITISHDITDRKRAEDALKESADFNRSLLKTIPFGMNIIDEYGTVLFQSENFRNISGSDAVGMKCWEVYRDDRTQCAECPLFRGIKIGITEIYESHGILGGKIFDIYHTGMMFHGKKAILEIFHDITRRKNVEAELINAKEKAEESDRLKTAFLHNISHEIRTPMNAIVGFSALLNENDLAPSDRESYLDIITQSSNHLLSIVSDIIEIANVEAGIMKANMAEININALFSRLYKQFLPKAVEKAIKFNVEMTLPDNKSDYITDNTKLVQVLSNLLANAFKFTDSGNIDFGYKIKDHFIEFFVSDTGVGIPEDMQLKIFNRFYQVDNKITRLHEGTGLGLSISKAYVEFLGGKIWLESAPDHGSVFYFTLPLNGSEKVPSDKGRTFINSDLKF
jgi:PAS domain S-box-containing protein